MGVLKQFLKTDRKCRRKFIYNFGIKGAFGFSRYQKRKKRGQLFPAFHFISVTDDCNLKCQGCWVTKGEKAEHMDIEHVDKIINAGNKKGSYFFGILGGEPLMYKPLIDVFKKHSKSYFQLFTNGTLITDSVANELRECANVTPLISFEGDENVADIRRGGSGIYNRTIKAIETCVKNKLITGVAMSVCKSNIDLALSDDFVNMLIEKGVMYLWYYIYRPSGVDQQYDLALSQEEINRLRKFMVEGRTKFDIILVDSYWDGKGEPFCPAAEGLSHHINPSGYIEPCPVLQFAKDNIKSSSLDEIYNQSDFLDSFRKEINKKTKGCIIMEDPEWLYNFMLNHKAINTSNREDFLEQLKNSPNICSHGSCERIPEKNRIYRIVKNKAFFGLGSYG